MLDTIGLIFYIGFGLFVLYKFARAIRIVPAQDVYIVERLGKYRKSLYAGFHPLVPFFDQVAYKLTLKEEAIDVPSQLCITRDNVLITVDGVVYMKVVDPYKAAYNVTNYRYALIQLAQTTMRSVFGHMDLDKTFEERESINAQIVKVVDEAADFWGIKILRYEIQNISPPDSVIDAMEKQMTAEREKRAVIAISEGDMRSKINRSEGMMQEMINRSEGEKQKLINEAEGRAREIEALAKATAIGIEKIAQSITQPGGANAVYLTLAEDYLRKLEGIASEGNQVILPMDLSRIDEVLGGLAEFAPGNPRKQ
ncbi:MAG: paraslipin [Spirochaetaceae bacterium]|nr:paraslipin [Spirochaetaceae bacterium]|tara:strand:+ start:8489 stop:9421 length:933 start_codon:yes stop_codon:yes gene_type:complete